MRLRRIGDPAGPVSAGERDKLVTILKRPAADEVEPSGFPKDTWTTLDTAFMFKEDVDARERFKADQQTSSFDTRWEMDYRANMDPELLDVPKLRRLVYQGRYHDVLAATQIGRKAAIELMTLAGSRIDA